MIAGLDVFQAAVGELNGLASGLYAHMMTGRCQG
jgi:hypothetical protein